MVDTETTEILKAASGAGEVSTQTSGIFLIWEQGIERFDKTTVGRATRRACYEVVRKFVKA
jgi:curli biogenesis system outer membrane secretion channel CsgG